MSAAAPEEANLGLTAEGLVLFASEDCPAGTPVVKGYDFNGGLDYSALFASYATSGFQATHLAAAIAEVNAMLRWRLSDEPVTPADDEETSDPAYRAATKATVWLAFTSNMVSCGVREVIRYLVEHKLVDVIVSSAGGVEEDIMKTLRPHYVGEFSTPGPGLRKRGLNRLGNLVVPNLNYVDFEDWISPLINQLHDAQEKTGEMCTPSKFIAAMGHKCTDPSSIWYWASRNGIPVFCPGLTDVAIGDMLYFHLWKRAGFVLDIAADVRAINDISVRAKKSGMVILGGGLVKHHTCNANLMRNGADWAVFINTGNEFDGSDSGARPDEAVSWGKIKLTANPVKVYAEASLVFPILVAESFHKYRVERDAKAAAAK